MQVPVAVAQVPVCWSVPRNLETISRAAETQRFVLAANVAHGAQHCPTMIVSPRGQVLAEAQVGTAAATLALTIDLADTRDTYLRQQRDDVVSIAWHG